MTSARYHRRRVPRETRAWAFLAGLVGGGGAGAAGGAAAGGTAAAAGTAAGTAGGTSLLSSLVHGITAGAPNAASAVARAAGEFGRGVAGANPWAGPGTPVGFSAEGAPASMAVPSGAAGSVPLANALPNMGGQLVGALNPTMRGVAQNILERPNPMTLDGMLQWAKPFLSPGGGGPGGGVRAQGGNPTGQTDGFSRLASIPQGLVDRVMAGLGADKGGPMAPPQPMNRRPVSPPVGWGMGFLG